MKTHLVRFAATLIVLGAVSQVAAADSPVIAFRDQPAAPVFSPELIQLGASRRDVESLLGAPPDRLNRDTWIYWEFKTTNEAGNRRGYDTLLIAFVEDRVVDLRVVPRQPVKQWLAQQRQRASESRVADASKTSVPESPSKPTP